MPKITPKFEDCVSCKIFSKTKIRLKCLNCDSGEFFEEKISDEELDENQLMKIYGEMKSHGNT